MIVRNLLAELAEKIDVRVLLWQGAPVPAFRPSRGDVRRARENLVRHTRIRSAVDGRTGLTHCHHEKTIVIDDRVAFVGGIDLTLDGGDPFDTATPPRARRDRVARRCRANRGAGGRRRRGALPAPLARGRHARSCRAPSVAEPAGDLELQITRTLPAKTYRAVRRGDYSILASYMGALRSAERLVYLENQFLWSPEIVEVLIDKLRDPPSDDFRVVVLLPARANDGADVSRGQIAALIHADDGAERFLACTVYARAGKLRDVVYVHAKIGIVDDTWFTIGSANLNAHSLFNDTEMNVVCLDPAVARGDAPAPLGGAPRGDPGGGRRAIPTALVDERWRPIAEEQLHRLENGEPLTHRLVMLPGVSRRRRRVLGPMQSRIFDL